MCVCVNVFVTASLSNISHPFTHTIIFSLPHTLSQPSPSYFFIIRPVYVSVSRLAPVSVWESVCVCVCLRECVCECVAVWERVCVCVSERVVRVWVWVWAFLTASFPQFFATSPSIKIFRPRGLLWMEGLQTFILKRSLVVGLVTPRHKKKLKK